MARHDIATALDEIRQIVEDLRPPALDELGLSGAIRQHAQRFPHLAVTVTESTDLGGLPAATEVAAYRIATEALTDTARHADATAATVDISNNGRLAIAIADNGTAHTGPWTLGVALHAMPDACVNLRFDLRDPRIAGVARLHTTHITLELGRSFHYAGIRLFPGVWRGDPNATVDRYVGEPYEGAT